MYNEWNNNSIDIENIINEFRNCYNDCQKVIIGTLSMQIEMMRMIGHESASLEIQRLIDQITKEHLD